MIFLSYTLYNYLLMSHLHTRNRKGKKEKKNREFIFEDDLEN